MALLESNLKSIIEMVIHEWIELKLPYIYIYSHNELNLRIELSNMMISGFFMNIKVLLILDKSNGLS